MKPKVLIIVEGGMIQNIISNTDDIDIAVVDYDGPIPFVTVGQPDEVYPNISECFDDEEGNYQMVLERLKEESFI